MSQRPNVKALGVLESSNLKATIKARRKELAEVKLMRDTFEKNERKALNKSSVYREVHKHKSLQVRGAEERLQKGVGESYVDSDRCIAVGLGAMDLKGQVEKYKYELGAAGSLNVHDLQQIHILVEQAKHDLRNNKPAAALHYVKRGQKLDPNVLEMMELKCQCLVKMNKYQEAVEAADTVLFKFGDALNSKALAAKAEASYNIGNFEQALLYFYRAFRTASVREKEDLEKGITLTRLAVTNAVGPEVSQYFKNMEKILPHLPGNFLSMPWRKVRQLVAVKETKESKRVKDRKFLSEMAKDKHYLERLKKTLQQNQGQSGDNSSILNECNNALGFLTERREFWSQQKPEYPKEIDLKLLERSPLSLEGLLPSLIAKQRSRQLCSEKEGPDPLTQEIENKEEKD